MKNLIIDIGNTSVKYAVLEQEQLCCLKRSENPDPTLIEGLLAEFAPGRAILCSTRQEPTEVVDLLHARGVEVVRFEADTPTPLCNAYRSPRTLGRDRLAAAVGAAALYPGRPLLIVDFGTAITCDLVSEGCYLGGFISPGLRMRYRALHDYTARLPEVERPTERLDYGTTTEECIAQGVEQGICYEIEGHIAHFSQKFENLLVVFTGGDGKHFVKRIKNTIFADCDLVIWGLNRILSYLCSI